MSTSSLQWVVARTSSASAIPAPRRQGADLLRHRRVFLIALGIFVVASALSGLLTAAPPPCGAVREGVSAAFTAPAAALSIITTTFAEGPAQQARSRVQTAGATGFSARPRLRRIADGDRLALVFFLPRPSRSSRCSPGLRLVPSARRRLSRNVDVAGAVA
jgi:hypothetical protein